MKKLLFALVMMFVSLNIFGQVQQWTLPSVMGQVPYGSNVKFSIHNTGTTPAVIRPLFSGAQNMQLNMPANIFQDSPTLIQWVRDATIGVAPEDHILVMALRIADLLKNEIWKNHAVISFEPETYAKDFSLMASIVGTHSTQCGNYGQIAAGMLVATGLVPLSKTRMRSSTHHTYLEIFHDNKWKIVDFDPGTPGFMTVNHLSCEELRTLGWPAAFSEFVPHQYYSVYTGLLSPGDDVFSGQLVDSTEWYEYFLGLTAYDANAPYPYTPYGFSPYETDGAIIIPPRGSLSLEYTEDFLRVDSTDAANAALFQGLRDIYNTYHDAVDDSTQQVALDEFVALLAGHFGLSDTEVMEVMAFGSVEICAAQWYPIFREHQIASYIKTFAPGYWELGVDGKAPGKVMSVTTGPLDEVHLWDVPGDDTTFTGLLEVNYWNSGDGPPFHVSNNASHYLQHGYVNAVDTVKFQISWNPVIFNFLHGELTIQSDQFDQLQVSYLINGEDFLQGEVVSVEPQEVEPLNVYPNPVSRNDLIHFPEDTYTLYNSLGMRVKTCNVCSSLALDGLNSGNYILVGSQNTSRVVIQ